MAWMKTLADTYNAYTDSAGNEKNAQSVLLPISHSTFNAQIEIVLDEDGNLIDAKKIEKGDAVTIIPVTEDSEARSSGVAPHPLCDKLCYIAKDYEKYTGEPKKDYYEAYMKQLSSWEQSIYTHPMIQAVYRYLEKGVVIKDLAEVGILKLDEDGKLTDQTKLQGQGQTGANVRFRVYGKERGQETAVWKNQELFQKYIQYCIGIDGREDLCYVSGKRVPCADKHPAKVRNAGDKAKIISGNDKEGFTYLGRFTNRNQAVSIGYETSQKAHNALRWLIQKQGNVSDGCAIVCWVINRDMPLPDIGQDSIHAYDGIDGIDTEAILLRAKNEPDTDTGMFFAKQFRNAVQGYAGKIKEDDRVAVIALDAANDKQQGRLSIVYYDEMGAGQYIAAIRNWQEHCGWKRYIFIRDSESEKGRQTLLIENSPAPRDMALAAFGVERTSRNNKGYLEADGKLLKNTIKRLLPCITKQGVKIPRDIIKAAVQRASRPETMDDFVWKNQVLCVACAMIRFNYEMEGENKMSTFLDDNIHDRNVLFGRLLAVCDYMEIRALFEKDESGKVKEQRTTNAKRYWNVYTRRPAQTFKTIRGNLIPYERKLSFYEEHYFNKCMEELNVLLAGAGFDNRALTELYLPGYYLQMEKMQEFFKKSNKEEKE